MIYVFIDLETWHAVQSETAPSPDQVQRSIDGLLFILRTSGTIEQLEAIDFEDLDSWSTIEQE